jgi:hypothetical protein
MFDRLYLSIDYELPIETRSYYITLKPSLHHIIVSLSRFALPCHYIAFLNKINVLYAYNEQQQHQGKVCAVGQCLWHTYGKPAPSAAPLSVIATSALKTLSMTTLHRDDVSKDRQRRFVTGNEVDSVELIE